MKLKLADGPCQDVRGWLQGSAVAPDAAGWDVNVGTIVGDASSITFGKAEGVSVGRSVGATATVGGTGVLLGAAACVSATMVNAAATAVLCISCGLKVGSTGAALPQALTKRPTMAIPAHVYFFN